ncbi:hypothetical protein XA68_15336 [Ophiocordyceps unilateralis]|uniref:Mitochondrial import inner membrane translocase subunit TIM50 n=1 Tax=Ophiocordyceps unilateralis TaxID=268505 RepID=A0A2A9P8L4_OPHUN|nr:hypothetical protein XA68_15336 [Ophiocordyceps unilateralis]
MNYSYGCRPPVIPEEVLPSKPPTRRKLRREITAPYTLSSLTQLYAELARNTGQPDPGQKTKELSKRQIRELTRIMNERENGIVKAKYLTPSLASGGVPEPTRAYLDQSLLPPAILPSPRKILIILDLNGSILYRPEHRRPSRFVERRHAGRFIDYCLDTFRLAIWSSARHQNVESMVNQMFSSEQRRQLVVVWSREHLGLSSDDYGSRVQCYKRLSTIWGNSDVQKSHPTAQLGGRWDQSNTVLVDDSREKGRSEPHNILTIPEFSVPEDDENHDVLPQVHDYLNELARQEDISRYMRLHPFEIDPFYQL